MSPKAVVTALVIAAALIGLAFFLNSRSPSTGAHEHLLQFAPGDVASISVTSPDQPPETVSRSGAGKWTWSSRNATWPAILPSLAQTSLGAIGDLHATSAAQRGATIPSKSHVITIGLTSGASHTIKVSPEKLGGLSLIQVDDQKPAMVDTAIFAPILEPGLSSWRIASAMPGLADASRITVTKDSNTLALARLEGKWNLSRPVSARANPQAVASLMSALSRIDIQRFQFADSSGSAQTGFTNPRMTARVETDQRIVDQAGSTRVQTNAQDLIVGAPANAQGSLLYAAPTPASPLWLLVDPADVAAIAMDPRTYLALTASDLAPADIFGINLRLTSGTRSYKRELDKWVLAPSSETADGQKVNALLTFLTQQPGEPEVIDPADAIHTLARIDLLDIKGGTVQILAAGYNSDGTFAIRSGNIAILYPRASPPELLDMPSFENMPPPIEFDPAFTPETVPTK